MMRLGSKSLMNLIFVGLFLLGGIATSYAATDLTLAIPASAVEGDGLLTAAGVVTCSEAPTADLTVELSSDDASEILVPATVTVTARQVSTTFDLTVIDDAEIDGTQTVTISVSAPGWTPASATVEILDNEDFSIYPSTDAGGFHSLALKDDGTVWGWGSNGNGQLGDGTNTNRAFPVQVSGLTNVIAIAAGFFHTVALKNDGTVWAWGGNYNGELGDGTNTNRALPVQVSGLTNVISIAAGFFYTVALKNDGTVWAWGYNFDGELGDGTTTDRTMPVQVSGLTDMIAIATGASHTLALKSDGTAWVWGYNGNGQLGDGTITNRILPVQVSDLTDVVAIAGGGSHTLALKSDGTVWAWGYNANGQLGDGTNTDRILPVQVFDLTDVVAIAGGGFHTLALKSDGTVWAWGYNYFGQIGDGTTVTKTTPVQAKGTYGEGFLNLISPDVLTVLVAQDAGEGDGVLSDGGTVSVSRSLSSDLVVDLISNDTSEVTVPTTVTIPAGQSSATFDLTIVEDTDIDETQTVTITASAAGWISGSDTIDVADNENSPPNAPMNPVPANDATDVATGSAEYEGYVFLSWTGGDPNQELGDTVTYDIYLGEGGASTKVADNISDTSSWVTLGTGIEPGTTYYWRVTARDSAGLETMSPEWQFTTRAPDLVVAGITYAPVTGILPNQEVTFTATILNNGAAPVVASFQVEFRIGGATIGSKTVDQILAGGESTQLIQTWTAEAGEHTLEVTADRGGTISESDEDNNSLSQTLPDIIDPAPPELVATVPLDDSSLQQNSQIIVILFDQHGIVDDSAVINSFSVTDGNSQAVSGNIAESDDRFTFTPGTVPMPDGAYQVSFTATDVAGNAQSHSFSFTVDTVPPPPPVIDPVASPINNPNPIITGTKEAYAAILINGTELIGNTAETAWQHTVTLQSGPNTFIFTARDRAGNLSEGASVDIFLDEVAPQEVSTLTLNKEGDGFSIKLDWSGYDEASQIDIASYRVYAENTNITSLTGITPKTTLPAGTFSYTVENLTRATTYWFVVVAVDAAGNTSGLGIPIYGAPVDVIPPEDVTDFTVSERYPDHLVLSWNPSADSMGDLAGHRIYYSDMPEGITLDSDLEAYDIVGLNPGTTYEFTITVYDTDGNESSGVTANGVTLYENPGDIIGEIGRLDDLNEVERTVMLKVRFQQPVVFAQPPSYNGGDTAVVRITDVRPDRFTLKLHEAPDRDGPHTLESVSYFVFEKGDWQLPDGKMLKIGAFDIAATTGRLPEPNFVTHQFSPGGFSSTPVVISQVQTNNDPHWVKTRMKDITRTEFEVALEEEQNKTTPHAAAETIGWLAIEPAAGTLGGHIYEAGLTSAVVSHEWYSGIGFNGFNQIPYFLASLSSYYGTDNAHLRYRNLTAAGVEVMVEEDTTYSSGIDHTSEIVGWLVVEGDGLFSSQPFIDTAPPELVNTEPADGASLQLVEQIVITLYDPYGRVDSGLVSSSIVVKDALDQDVGGSVAISGDQYIFTPATVPLPDDIYHIAFIAADDSGNRQNYEFAFEADNQPPSEPAISGGTVLSGTIQPRPAENASNSLLITLTGSREDDTRVWVNGSPVVELGSGEWSADLNLIQGGNAFEVWLEDAADNRGPSVWVDITADTIAPVINSVTPPENSFLKIAPEAVSVEYEEAVSGLNLANSTRLIKDSSQEEIDGSWEISGDGLLIFTPTDIFAEETYSITLSLEDNYANRGQETEYHFTVDATPPLPPEPDPVDASTHKVTQLVTGTKEAYAAILLGGQEVVGHTADTAWQCTVSLENGNNHFSFQARDRAGNISEAAVAEIILDDIAPLPVDNLWVNRQGNGTYVTLNWAGYDESVHGDIDHYRIYVQSYEFSDVSGLSVHDTVTSGTFSYRVNNLIEGETYYFAVVAVDVKGNALTTVTSVSESPQKVTFVSGEITKNTTWTLAGSPYIVTADVTVRHPSTSHYNSPASVKLTIDPGVEVRFNAGTGLYLGKNYNSSYGYYGALSAQGTAEAPITFTSNASSPAPGDWKGIYFRNETHDAQTLLEHCIIEYGGNTHGANVIYVSANPPIKSGTIRYSSGHGIYLDGGSNPAIGDQEGGNLIVQNEKYGVYCQDTEPRPTIRYNTISQNGSYAIRVRARMAEVHHNQVSDNGIKAIQILGEEITTNTSWYNNGVPFVVTSDVTVRHPNTSHYSSPASVKLTIDPGVEVRFNAGTGLYVGKNYNSSYGYYGALLAQGTAEAPITFTSNAASPATGDWKGIYFRSETHDAQTLLEHCIIEYGGHTNQAGIYCLNSSPTINFSTVQLSEGSGLHMRGGAPVLKNCRISENTGSGIYLEDSATPHVGGPNEGNEITANGSYGIYSKDASPYPLIESNKISHNGSYPIRVGACMRVYKNPITANVIQAIEVLGEEITENTTWVYNGVPFIITGDVTVRHPSTSHYNSPASVKLTIEPGAEVRFNAGTGLYLGKNYNSSYGYYGALSALGTAEAPITFTSNASLPAPGDWKGIYFRNETHDAATSLEYCMIEYGGHTHGANVTYISANPSIKNSTIRYGSGHGIYVKSSSPNIENNLIFQNGLYGLYCENDSAPNIRNNNFSKNGKNPVILHPNVVRKAAGNEGTENGEDYIEVRGGEITSDGIWQKQGFEYIVTGDVTVRHSSTSHYNSPASVKLTIDPGVEVRFTAGTGLYLGKNYNSSYGYYGALSAQGTAQAPITFTSNAASPAPGDWKGIYFRNETHDAQTLLEHCIIEYGGNTHNANLYLANAKPTLQYNTVRNSSHSGVYVDGTGSNGVPIRCNNLKDNFYGVSVVNNAAPVITNNNFLRNKNYGISNSGTATVNAVDNWWNAAEGPGHNGDDVYGSVNFTPWLTAESDCIASPPTNTAPFAPKNPVPADGAVRVPVLAEGQPVAVALSWTGGDPNPWDTVVYDLYFGSAADNLVKVAEGIETASFDKADLAQGTTYFWKVVARDDADAEAAGPVWHFTTLGAPPDLVVSEVVWNPASDLQAGQAITFTATVENAGSGPVVDAFTVTFFVDGNSIGSKPFNPVVPENTSFAVSLPWTAATGNHTIEVKADSQGKVDELYEENNSRTADLPYVKDPTPPELLGTTPADGASVKQADQIIFTLYDQYGAVDDAAVIASVAVLNGDSQPVGGTVSEGSDRFTFTPGTVPLADDTYRVSLTARDLEGNTRDYSFLFTVDGRPPAAPEITGGAVLSGLIQARPVQNKAKTATVILTGTREDGTAVYVNNQKKVNLGSGNWSASLSLAQDDNALEIRLQDAAGNSGQSVWVDIQVDSAAPAITGITPADNSFINAAPAAVTATFTEAVSGLNLDSSMLSILDGSQQPVAGAWAAAGSNQLIFTPAAALADAYYTVSLRLEDQFGNSSAVKTSHFTLDTTQPPAPKVNPVSSPTHIPTQEISGTKEAYAALLLNGSQIVGHTAQTDWTHTVNLSAGTNSFSFAVRDQAGNQSEPATVEIFFDDVPPPAVDTLKLNTDGDGRTIELDWSGYDEALHGDVASYRIYQATAAFTDVSAAALIGTVGAGHFKYTAGDLTRGATYWFAVVAVDTRGNARTTATPVSGIPQDVLPPEDVSNLKTQSFSDKLVFTWSPSADTHGDLVGYRVIFADSEAVVLGKDQASFTKESLNAATGYLFKVIAFDKDGNDSSGITVTGVTLLANPDHVTAQVHSGYVDLSWSGVMPSQYVKHYAIYASESDFSSVAGMTPTITSKNTAAKVAGLTDNVTYYFAVTTVNISDGEQTTVATISAQPEPDSQGPEISSVRVDELPLSDGHTLVKPAAFSCEAADPAGVSRVEFSIDGSLVRTDYNATYTCFWNVVEVQDGVHTLSIDAYDTLGNRTTESYSLNVALALPDAPLITHPAAGMLTNKRTITVSGWAEKYTEITLYNNGADTGVTVAVDAFGGFSTPLTLVEGENRLQAAAGNRAGLGPKSAEVPVTLDTTLPLSPSNLVAVAKAAGAVRLTWQAPAGTEVAGYNLYRASASFTSPQGAGKINTHLIQATAFDDLPPSDGTWYYRVSTVDAAANESDLSAEAAAVADGTPPRASGIDYSPRGAFDAQTGTMAPGTVDVVLTVNEPLQSAPYLSIAPEGGIPIAVQLNKETDTTYSGFFVISEDTPSGTAYAIFSARDAVGNRGTDIDAGGSVKIDTDGPSVTRLVISPDAPVQNDEQNPVMIIVTLGLDEKIKSTCFPQLSYQLSGDGREPIVIDTLTELAAQSGDVQTWQAQFALPADAGLNGAETLAFIYQGVDALDNIGRRIRAENLFQVYQGELPPLAPPIEFKAQSLPGGKIRLSWLPVEQAVGYQLYRQAPGEDELSAYARLDAVEQFEDTPVEDGLYTYAIASIRQENEQEAVSGLSSPVTANSDSAAPGAPQNLSLELVANGIKLAWQPPAYTEEVTYSIYRAADEILTVEGRTPLAGGISQTMAVDPTPSPAAHWYVVTAVDAVGNESPPSNAYYLNFQLLPVAGIAVVQADDDPPQVSWTHPGGDIAGYDIYLGAGQAPIKLNQTLLTAKTYTDSGYAGDERRYTIIAVDNSGVESLGRSITLPVLRAVLSDGSRIERGIMNRLDYGVSNEGAGRVENIRLKVKVGSYDHTSDLFSLDPGTSRTVPVVVGGYDDLAGVAALTTTIETTPQINDTVQIVRSGQIEVTDGMLGLQILNEEFTRAASGQVQFVIENTGEAEIEIVTAKNSGQAASDQITYYLLDEDGNVLSSRAFKQATGEKLVTLSNKNTVARIGAGETFSSDMISMPVPANAPDNVVLRLEIARVYYHQGQATQVAMVGLATTHEVALVDTAYFGEVTDITPQNSTGDQDIVITGRAVERASGAPMADVPLKLVITLNGFERTYNVFTGANGIFSHTFKPLAGESGIYKVRAVHPDLTDKPVHGQFVINKVAVTPAVLNLNVPRNYNQTVKIQVQTGDGTSVSDLHLEYAAEDQATGEKPDGIHLTPGDPIAQMGGKQTAYLPFTIWADNTADQTDKLVLKVKSAESAPGAWGTVTINTYFSQAKPVLTFTPNHVETGLAQDQTVTETITLKNSGLADMHDVQLLLLNPDGTPAPNWVYLSSTLGIKNLAVGNTQQVGVTFAPTSAVADGDYAFKLRVAAANIATTDINVYAAVTQSGTGSILFKLSDIYTGTLAKNGDLIQGLAGARVKLQNEKTLSIEYNQTSDSYGEAYFENIPAGPYKCRITANNHQEYIGRVWIKPGVTATEDVFLDYNLVTVEWQVNEITIEDKYEIVLSATYETNVPAAVVVIEPASVTLPAMKAGDVFNGEFTLTNYGLIRSDQLKLSLPINDEYFIYEVLGGLPESIAAKSRITVPYRITCIKALDPADDGAATGGGCSSYRSCARVDYGYECANGVWTLGSGTLCWTRTYGTCGGGSVPGISGGGSWNVGSGLGSSGTISKPAPTPKQIEGVKCFPEWLCSEVFLKIEKGIQALKDTWKWVKENVGCSVNMVNRQYNDHSVDMVVGIPGGMITLDRTFNNDEWSWPDYLSRLTFLPDGVTQGIKSIYKQCVEYNRSATDANVYTHDNYRIIVNEAGYLWEDKNGNWKQFDENGHLTAFGNRLGTTGNMVYDESGADDQPQGITDQDGRQVLWFEYNDDNQLSAVQDAENRRVEYTYTGGRLTEVKDVLGNVTSYEYNSKGQLTRSIDAAGRPTSVTYDKYGNVASVVDAEGKGHFFQFDYDQSRQVYHAQVQTSSGRVKEVWYDRNGETKQVDINGRRLLKIEKDGRNLVITDEKGLVTRKEYDEWDNLTRIVNPDGTSVTFEYEHRFNKVTRVVDPRGIVALFEYDEKGNLVKKTEAAGTADERISTYTYYESGKLKSATVVADADTQAATTTFTYDERGNVATITDPMNHVTRFLEYDNMGNLLKMQDPRGNQWLFQYDAMGRLVSQTDPLGNINAYEYDGANNRTAVINAYLKRFEFEYDDHNNLIKAIDPYQKYIATEYNTDNLPVKVIDQEGKYSNVLYDNEGRVLKTIDGAGNEVVYTYDETAATTVSSYKPVRIDYPTFSRRFYYDKMERVVRETDILDETTSFSRSYVYDKAGNVVATTDEEENDSRFEYDALNRLVKTIDARGGEVKRKYDDRGNLIEIQDPNQGITWYEYDLNNRLVKVIRPMLEETSYEYDEMGNRTAVLDSKGQKIAYEYNALNRMTRVLYYGAGDHVTPVKTVDFEYDKLGNLTFYDDGTSSATYEYDDLQRKIRETVDYGLFTKTIEYTYFANGLEKSFTGPDGDSVSYSYDDNNRLTGVAIPDQGQITYLYDSAHWNSPAGKLLPGGSREDYSYDPLMRIKSIIAKDPAQNPRMTRNYTYSPAGNINIKNTEHGEYQYQYDELQQLTAAVNPLGSNEAYTYDPLGNRLTAAGVPGTWSYNANNELESYGNVSFSYDENGNTTRKTVGVAETNYSYDVEDRLVRVDDGLGAEIASYYYDPFGRRLYKEVDGQRIYFVYSDEGLIGEYDETGAEIRAYGWMPDSQWSTDPLFYKQQGQYYWYQNDHLGTPQKIISTSGRVVWSAVYDSFGNCQIQTAEIENNLRFAGQYYDAETGLYYNLNRYYDPVTGRYLRTDPYGDGLNLYAYVFNNPLSSVDPLGLCAIRWGQRALGLALDALTGRKLISYLRASLQAAELNNAFTQVLGATGVALLTVVEGVLYSPDALVQEVIDFVQDPLNPTKIPILGPLGKELGESTAAAIDDPNILTISRAVGAYSQAVLLVLGPKAIKERLAPKRIVGSGMGRDIRPMKIIREIRHGEKIADITNEVSRLTWLDNVEHAVVKLKDGRRVIVSGGEHGIELGPEVTRIYGHSHPWSLPPSGPSPGDVNALKSLKQRSSYLLERGERSKFWTGN